MYKNYDLFQFFIFSNPLFIKLKVLNVCEIIKLQQYEFLGNSLPDDLKGMFKLNSDIHNQLTRQLFHIPAVNSTT